ncbi:O-antigen ligase family protein [Mucilaginibacter panaciglaebae]
MHLSKKGKGFWWNVKKQFLLEKLYNPVGITLLILLAAFIAVGIAKFGVVFGMLFLIMVVGLPTVYGVVVYPQFGIIILLVMAYMLFMLMRLGVSGPIGVIMDVLQFLMMLGLVIKQRKDRNWAELKGPVSTMILIWLAYNVLQIANPFTEARAAWIYTIRSVAVVMLSYFVFLYNIRSVAFIRLIIKIWLAMSFFAAFYAAKQEYIGFSAVEEAYLHSDPNIASLLFIAGHWRKFSIFSDPVTFAYNMSMSAIFCIAMIAGKRALWKKIVLAFLAMSFLVAMLYSGTRGANVLVPAALFLFAILNYNRKVLIFTGVAAVFLVILINVPTGDPNLKRFQTAFRPNDDDSYNLRKANQKRIQPYILSHPVGGGLGATGTWGQRFAPNSYLANFPPDSGYIRISVELGWIGLFIFCMLMFTVLKTGINNFYLIKDPELKTYCLGFTLIIFAYNIANFPQEALVQYPSNIYFSMDMALISVLLRLDREKQQIAVTGKSQLT